MDYENKHKIPKDWINYAISQSAPDGHWQRLERGEIKMDADFFRGFNTDLHNAEIWKKYHSSFRSSKKKLKDLANPTQLGDHVSLKAEVADSTPTDNDRGAQSPPSDNQAAPSAPPKTLKELTKANPTQLGDPVSLKAETAESEPTDNDRGAGLTSRQNQSPFSSSSSPQKKLKDLAKENPSQLGDTVSLKAETASSTPTGNDRGAQSFDPPSQAPSHNSGSSHIPPIPTIDGESLFWQMMKISQEPDPYVYPALQTLSRSHPQFLLGALSNTVVFPPSHPYSLPSPARTALHNLFSVFIASAEVGLRKPHPEIYELAIKRLDKFDREKGESGITAQDIVFLDDIGQNLKAAKDTGMRTIRVQLGKTWRAVKELEGVIGVELMDERTRRSKL